MTDTKDKKNVIIKNVGIAAGILLAGAGVGYFIGFKQSEANNDFIWKSILLDAVNNGSTTLTWDNESGTKSLKFLIDFVEEIKK